MLLNRYLGNKAALLPSILKLTAERCKPGDRVLDAFAGSLAVSMAYKEAGYIVSANDINPLSEVFGRAYIANSAIPEVPIDILFTKRKAELLRKEAAARLNALVGLPGYTCLSEMSQRSRVLDLLAVTQHLQLVEGDELLPSFDRSDFFDAYCPEGRYSEFKSSRGTLGRRRFLTADNARRLDLILNQLRQWRSRNLLDEPAHSMFLAMTCLALEKVANTQGTYHDFPREIWDSRAFKPLTLNPPAFDRILRGAGQHTVGRADSREYVRKAGTHRLMYVDPPYNFRQYTAYYFLPNLVVKYPDIENPEEYFAGLTFVRGQNPADDFSSDFCSARKFIPAIHDLITAADVDCVLISYFTGKNHWSNFDEGRDDRGLAYLSELLGGTEFVRGSLNVVEVPRKNYASYGGYQARDVHELLLLADKKR